MPEPLDCRPIAYVAARFPSWSETFISRDVRLLVEAGLPILPISLWPGDAPLPEGVPAPIVLAPEAPPPAAVGHSRQLRPRLLHRYASLLKHAGLLMHLERLIGERDVRHLHAAFADLPGLLVAAAAQHLVVPYSIEMHANDALHRKFDDRFLFAKADFLAICNRRVHQRFVGDCPAYAAKTHLLYHGIELARWPWREAPAPASPPRLLFIGRLIPRKQPLVALAVARELGARLTVVGDGPLRAEIEADPAADCRGVLAPDAVARELASHDALLLCSTESTDDMEGLPNVLLEAMACGLPVVGAPTGSIGELLDASTGWPAAEPAVDALVAALRTRLADPAEALRRAQVARQRVEADYQAETLIQQRLRLFQP